ncbi:hypothetical protein F5Y19DRAFT_14764 [Xylariaceae sp. FL1651]|nr:hypothetical protein F5Y19DRAFT_14764 [Xylariaceae sp. FL1651]
MESESVESDVYGQDALNISKQDLVKKISKLEEKLRLYEGPARSEVGAARTQSFTYGAPTEVSEDAEFQTPHQMQLSTANTIPKVRKCNFVQFKNRFKPDEGNYAIDVLVSGPLLEQEVLDEQKTRDIVASRSGKGKTSAKETAARLPSSNPVSQLKPSDTQIQRIRIQSPALLKIMSRVQEESWSSRSRTFWRPFEPLIFYQDKMKEALNDLEDKWRGHTARDYEASLDTSSTDTPASEVDAIDSDPATLDVVRCYVQFIEQEIMPLYTQFDQLDAYSRPVDRRVQFSDLWYLFRPGNLVYYLPTKKDTTDNRDIIGSERLWRTHHIQLSVSQDQLSLRKYRKYQNEDDPNDNGAFKVKCHYIDYTGEEFCVVTKTFPILPYSGFRDITTLGVFPLRFFPNYTKVEEDNIEIANTVLRFIESPHGTYNAWTVMRAPNGEAVVDENGKTLTHPEHIHSDVMVDFGEAFQACPAWKPKRKILGKKSPIQDDVLDLFPVLWWSDTSRSKQQGEMMEIITRTGVGALERNRYLSEDEFHRAVTENIAKGQLTTQNYLRDQDKAIVSRRVFAYVFQERKFAQLDVRKIRSTLGSRDALDSLRIDQKVKELVQRSVRGHLLRRDAERKEQMGKMSMDMTPGKGDGLFILLHGVPGVGKTATAEAIAQSHGKPLFKITCGDLGLTPELVELRLRHVFRLASLWDCILLLDEVDTFFTQRSKGDAAMTKNALVSVFLRILDYYNGILFMTTNRAGTLDEAFKSRIHCSIYYPPLTKLQTREIWQINMQRLKLVEAEQSKHDILGPMEILEGEILDFAESQFNTKPQHRWNGRQIRNAFQVARSLARADAAAERDRILSSGSHDKIPAPRLDVKYFWEMNEMGMHFNEYLQSIYHGKTDGDLAHEMEVRNDEWKNPRPRYSYHHTDSPKEVGYQPRPNFDAEQPISSSGWDWGQRHSYSGTSGFEHSEQATSGQQPWGAYLSSDRHDERSHNGPLPEALRSPPSVPSQRHDSAPLSGWRDMPRRHFGDENYDREGNNMANQRAFSGL